MDYVSDIDLELTGFQLEVDLDREGNVNLELKGIQLEACRGKVTPIPSWGKLSSSLRGFLNRLFTDDCFLSACSETAFRVPYIACGDLELNCVQLEVELNTLFLGLTAVYSVKLRSLSVSLSVGDSGSAIRSSGCVNS
ncbi:hypothetical protein PGTUg99_002251 [Puccinia graminis f. sp. tritici]|uniref:Uncharacterized protein n=1 Tax=Puccinia graminis f. sp. tritici TaxID=56615 RepID=A0A5B0QLC4_PUCGR|nr:hypothetical protein PGTUg99_002251 [Puccinia graminis f. sp. tritici]